MQSFEAEKTNANALLVVAVFYIIMEAFLLIPILLFLAFPYRSFPQEFPYVIWFALLISCTCLLVSSIYDWSKRRRIHEYQIWDDKIVIRDTDTEILFEQITDVEIGRGRGTKKRDGARYLINEGSQYCSYPVLAEDAGYSGNAVFVYTTIKTNIPLLGKMNNYLVLTPIDREGFVNALKDKLERHRTRKYNAR